MRSGWRLCLLWLLSCLAAPAGEAVRVMCWNLHHGVGVDGKLDLERIAAVIREARPDLVALQEVDRRTGRTGGVDQTAELARLTGLSGVFGKAMDYDGGEYGQAILSRHPLGATAVHRLPGDGEPRIAFEARVTVAGKEWRMISTHLDHQQDARRLAQAETLRQMLEKEALPTVLTGDFNDTADSAAMKAFGAGWELVPTKENAATFPAKKPSARIDHMLLSGLEAAGPVTVLPEAVASDHRPMVVDVVLP